MTIPKATSAAPCLNCGDPSDELFCGMCREMGCSVSPIPKTAPTTTPAPEMLALEQRCLDFLLADNKKARTTVIAAHEFASFVSKEIEAALRTAATRDDAGVREAVAQFFHEHRNDTRNYLLQADDLLSLLHNSTAPAQCDVQIASDAEEVAYDRSNSVHVAWIAFADNGNIRLWTADEGRAKEEKQRGLDLRAFTLAELVTLVGRPHTYTEICMNEKCPRGGTPVEVVRSSPLSSAQSNSEGGK